MVMKPGDTGKAICEECARLTDIVYERRPVPIGDTGKTAVIVAGICTGCGTVIAVPSCQEAAIQSALAEP